MHPSYLTICKWTLWSCCSYHKDITVHSHLNGYSRIWKSLRQWSSSLPLQCFYSSKSTSGNTRFVLGTYPTNVISSTKLSNIVNFLWLWMRFVSYNDWMEHIINFNIAASWIVFQPPIFHQCSHLRYSIPSGSCRINVYKKIKHYGGYLNLEHLKLEDRLWLL